MRFLKEQDGRWYVDLPEWTGERWELEMVSGADLLCDILAQGSDTIDVLVSLVPSEGSYKLEKIENTPEIGGATYHVSGELTEGFDLWLCHVTSFVLGSIPQTIYIK